MENKSHQANDLMNDGDGNQSNRATTIQSAALERQHESLISATVVSSTPGRLRLRVAPQHRQPKQIKRIASALEAHPQIERLQTNLESGSITIYYALKDGRWENVIPTLRDWGIVVYRQLPQEKSQAAASLSNAAKSLNQQVALVTKSVVDLRFLFSVGLSVLALRQLRTQGWQFETIPWYVLAWYAFDSFIKLHNHNQPQLTTKS